MKFYTKQHPHYCGVNLHADAMYACILDATGEVMIHQAIPTRPKAFLHLIKPYRAGLVVGCGYMFTWYCLADLCVDEGIDFVLGHALYMRAIHGGKAKNDKILFQNTATQIRSDVRVGPRRCLPTAANICFNIFYKIANSFFGY